jgi:hypothetical protein
VETVALVVDETPLVQGVVDGRARGRLRPRLGEPAGVELLQAIVGRHELALGHGGILPRDHDLRRGHVERDEVGDAHVERRRVDVKGDGDIVGGFGTEREVR